MKAAFNTDGSTITQRALSSRSWGISSGISRISFITVPAFCRRSTSFVSSAFGALGPAKAKGANARAATNVVFQRFIFCLLFLCEKCSPTCLLLPVHSQHSDSTKQSDCAQDWGQWNGVPFLFCYLNWTHVHGFLRNRVTEALVGKSQNPQNNQRNSQQCFAAHL